VKLKKEKKGVVYATANKADQVKEEEENVTKQETGTRD